jgi:hypothetical protein
MEADWKVSEEPMIEQWLCLACNNTGPLDEHAHCGLCNSDNLSWAGVVQGVSSFYHGEEAMNGVGRKVSYCSRFAKWFFGIVGQWILRIRKWEEEREHRNSNALRFLPEVHTRQG